MSIKQCLDKTDMRFQIVRHAQTSRTHFGCFQPAIYNLKTMKIKKKPSYYMIELTNTKLKMF